MVGGWEKVVASLLTFLPSYLHIHHPLTFRIFLKEERHGRRELI